eukprot:4629186-Amphidinium_carterae.1
MCANTGCGNQLFDAFAMASSGVRADTCVAIVAEVWRHQRHSSNGLTLGAAFIVLPWVCYSAAAIHRLREAEGWCFPTEFDRKRGRHT